ncbi:MAG: hypothetical protein IKB93_17595 [Clostridia bacterium]|nr:hypothetical protein [Clostridia bacterium]MBR2886580.1 hypothetical protein [Clostridia bacterium]
MTEFFIPTNFEDSGKLMGIFNMRNVIEAGILSLPFVFLTFKLVPVSLTWKIILSAVFAIPIGGFALIGINDDPLTVFVKNWWRWLRNRKIIEYRGEVK